jgi:Ca2+:H+ antiporter
MNGLLRTFRAKPMMWLLAFVPVLFIAQARNPEAHTWLFVLSVLAIVPLAGLLSQATESVAARTGDTVGGLLNATLGNLTELVIALAALRAGQYLLVKASIAGAIVTNNGRSAWFVGVLVVMVYVIFGMTLYLLPPTDTT